MPNSIHSNSWTRFLNGQSNVPFVPKRKVCYTVAVIIVLLGVLCMIFKGFTPGIDFQGGTKVSFQPNGQATTAQVSEDFSAATGITPQSVTFVGSGASKSIEIVSEHLNEKQIIAGKDAMLASMPQSASFSDISDSSISESWGDTITKRMLMALLVFLIVVFMYISIRFTRVMASSAILCVLFDLTVVSSLYSLLGFEVSPATVIGLLTILAYSLYDTVVVFDKINENTGGSISSQEFPHEVNRSINQTIIRSINTSLFSLFPILAMFIVAVGIMGVSTLKDLALVQLLGVIVGTLSSLFLAGPMLVTFTEKQRTLAVPRRAHSTKQSEMLDSVLRTPVLPPSELLEGYDIAPDGSTNSSNDDMEGDTTGSTAPHEKNR